VTTTPTSWTTATLLSATFPEPRWAVPDILPTGLALLAGRPKLGKSFLALQLAITIGSGGAFLGRPIKPGKALYLALEDSGRRLQSRLRTMGATPSCRIRFELDWPMLDGDGMHRLRSVVAEGQPVLVVIDTISRAVSGRIDWDRVGPVTAVLDELQGIAIEFDACILLIDHHRKPGISGGNVIDDVMNSTGKTGVADTVWGLYRQRGQHAATLKTCGRDVDEQELSLRFDALAHCWQLADATTGVQSAIVSALETAGDATVTELSKYLGKDKGNLSRELAELADKGLVRRRSEGRTAPWTLWQ
jgi:RecA-family ATPase